MTKNILLSCLRYWDRGLLVVIVYYFQIWNKKSTALLVVVELLAVTWVPCMLRPTIYIYIYIYILVLLSTHTHIHTQTHTHTHTHIYIYIYIYIALVISLVRKWDSLRSTADYVYAILDLSNLYCRLAVPGHALLWLSLFEWKKKKRKCMFLICLIFQYLWMHNILGSSSFRVDKEIVWIADSGTGNI